MTRSPLIVVTLEPLAFFYTNHLYKQTSPASTYNFSGYRLFCGLNDKDETRIFFLKSV
jgi:hypothetical protein